MAFESLWCRFIMRYLRDSEQLNPTDPMIYYLNFIRWPIGTDIDELEDKQETMDLFGVLQVQHSFEVWVYVNNIQAETLRTPVYCNFTAIYYNCNCMICLSLLTILVLLMFPYNVSDMYAILCGVWILSSVP